MALISGVRLGPYEIVALIGSGGMGEVYRARDSRLDRIVAVKVLPPALAGNNEWRQRFEREARVISSLAHPHICTLYDIGEADGISFLVMEHLEGETLAVRLARGALPLDQALGYAIQIAESLDHAHRHGVVHRDLKPGNIMLTPVGAKLLDFGLAKAQRIATASLPPHVSREETELRQLTEHGVILGTMRYMAPEQLEGREADSRSDLFAFGTVMYEMAAGRCPFDGSSQAAIVAAILDREPPALSTIQPQAPRDLDHLIERCLAKAADDRWQTARDVVAELKWIADNRSTAPASVPKQPLLRRAKRFVRSSPRAFAAVAAVVVALAALGLFGGDFFTAGRWLERALAPVGRVVVQSLAVLPLRNLSRDPEQEYFADGMTEALITDLSKLGTSRVISRSSVMQYKDAKKSTPEIARALNVDAVVDGSVMRAGDRVRISAQLVDAKTDRHLWADSYERELRDVFALQEQVAQAIAREIGGRLQPASGRRAPRSRTTTPEVYELYLKGRYSWNKYNEEGWNEALRYFGEAVRIDRSYAPAWAGIADAYYGLSSTVVAPHDVIPKAREAAVTALTIDDTLAEAHASLGLIKAQYDWDRLGAERDLNRAIVLDSNNAMAYHALGMLYYADGLFERAHTNFELARQLDPLSLIMGATAIWPLPHLGRSAEALQRLEHLTSLHPEVPDLTGYLHELRGDVMVDKGMNDQAVAEFLQGYNVRVLTGGGEQALAAMKTAYAKTGLDGFWRAQLELAKAKYQADLVQAATESPPKYVSAFEIARLHARVGNVDETFTLLDRCLQYRDERLLYLKAESLSPNSPWQSVRSDRRFAEVLRRLGLKSAG